MITPRRIVAFAVLLPVTSLGAQATVPVRDPGPRLAIIAVTAPLFDGATVTVPADAGQVRAGVHKTTAIVEGDAFELFVPGAEVPAELVVEWSPRVRQVFALQTPELAATITRGADGARRLELRLTARGVVPAAPPATVDGALGGRFGGRAGGRDAPPSEVVRAARAALDQGLVWLRAQQQPDGGWPTNCPDDPHATVDSRGLATAAACMAMIGNGSTVHSGPDRRAVMRGLCWLVEHTDPRSGRIARATAIAPLEEQAVVALALGEAWLLSRFEPLREAAGASTGALAAMLGDATVADRRDIGALAFALFALTSGRDWGDQEDALARVRDALSERVGGAGLLGDAAALLAGTMGGDAELAAVDERAPRLLKELPARGATQDATYVYLGTMALYMAREPHWTTWREGMAGLVADGRVADGDAAGSWPPADPGAQMRGRVWTTAMRVLALQIVHRFAR